jgi:hypothetical protein
MTATVVAAAGVAVSLFLLGDPVAAEHQRAVIWQYAAIRQSVQALSLDSWGEYNRGNEYDCEERSDRRPTSTSSIYDRKCVHLSR